MASGNQFAHGSYADDSGIIFYGPPVDGFWRDQLQVSNRFIGPLFNAVLDQGRNDDRTNSVPKIVSQWNELTGWIAADGIQEIGREDAEQLIAALAAVSLSDVVANTTGSTAEECLLCASAIADFLATRLAAGQPVYIEND